MVAGKFWLVFVLTVMFTLGSTGVAQDMKADDPSATTQASPTPTPTPAASPDPQDAKTPQKKEKRGSWILAPIPIFSPAIGAGVVPVVGYIFKLRESDMVSPPSVIGGLAVFTNNGTRVGVVGGRFYFDEKKYQMAFAAVKARVNVDFYGIGRIPGVDAIAVPLKARGDIIFGEFLRNVGKNIFIGPRYQYRYLGFGIDREEQPPPGGFNFEVPPIDVRSKSNSLGFKIQRDTRDSNFYPTKGSLFEARADFYSHFIGSARQNQVYNVAYNGYRALSPKRVLAYRGMMCSANQDVPFYNLCLFGASNDLRGYTAGEFQNRRMFALQSELRQSLKGRFGMVVFAGVGGVARRWNEFRSDRLLPAAGAGLRFTLDKKNRVNYRVDWAIGRAGYTFVIGVAEAF